MPILPNRSSCVFCGAQPLSEEHVFAKWLRRHVLRTTGANHQQLMSYGRKWVAGDAGWEQTRRALTDTVYAPCRHCNNSWMSEIENKLHKVLASMIDGRPVTIDQEEQRFLASWTLKTAMMVTLAKVADVPRFNNIIPRSHFEHLYATKEPPATTAVWLAAHGYDLTFLDFRNVPFSFSLDGPAHDLASGDKAYLATLRIGSFLVQICGVERPQPKFLEKLLGTAFDDSTIRIWPPLPTDIAWPPAPMITTEQRRKFEYRFMPPVGFVIPQQDRDRPILVATDMQDLLTHSWSPNH